MLRFVGVIAVIVASEAFVTDARGQEISPDPAARFADAIRVSFESPAGSPHVDFTVGPQEPQKATPPPQPRHTGIPSLVFESASDFIEFPQRKSTWVVLAVGGLTALAVHPLDDDVNRHLTGNDTASKIFSLGKYLGGVAQVSAAVGMYAIGRYALPPENGTAHTNKWSHLGFDLLRAQLVTQIYTQAIKQTVRRDRPTGECCSFPSGHSATTFATAAVLERHLGLRGAWPTLLIASYVAASRLHDNRHFLSDVVFGAALGTATGWTVVGRHGGKSFAFVPVKTPGGVAMMLVSRDATPGG